MNENPSDDARLRSYLLEELPEPEADALERRLLADDELFDLLEAHEAELLAAASRGELPAAEKERVLRRLAASPGGRERLALARSLNAEADRLADSPPWSRVLPFIRRDVPARAVWSGLAAAAALLLVVGLWFALQRFTADAPPLTSQRWTAPANPVRPTPPEEPTQRIAETPARPDPQPEVAQKEQPARGAVEQRQPVTATFALSLMTLRGRGGNEEFSIAAGTDLVEIQIDLEGLEDLEPYHAAVRSEENETIWEKAGLTPKQLDWGTALVLEIPAERLPAGTYRVAVTAGTETLEQDFMVIREGR